MACGLGDLALRHLLASPDRDESMPVVLERKQIAEKL
jgi:hypothetical protein